MTHRKLQHWRRAAAAVLIVAAFGQALAEETAGLEGASACVPVSRVEASVTLDFCAMPSRSRSLGQRECRTVEPTAPAIMARALIGEAGAETADCGANFTPVPNQTLVPEQCAAASALQAYRRQCAAAGDCDAAYLALTQSYAEALLSGDTGCL
ncbi:MAG: hypothetical protein OEM59_23115 [Rhodospirillales bacterium]|nr:hypothetical protein [Rhodospirillales bacterium]